MTSRLFVASALFAGVMAAGTSFGVAKAEAGDAAAGETRYAETCKNCHGPKGQGMASFPQIGGKDAEYLTGRLNQYRAGETVGPNSGLMIPMAADLSDDDIANLAAYLSAQ